MAEPLSIVVSITGITVAAAKVISLLTQIQDAPASISSIVTELDHVKLVFTAFLKFFEHMQSISGTTAALIELDDILVILIRTVEIFSKLQQLVSPLCSGGRLSWGQKITWPRYEAAARRLLDQLQRNHISLTLLLQIIQCDSILSAEETANSLHNHIEQEIEADPDITQQLSLLELPEEQTELNPSKNGYRDELDELQTTPLDEASDPQTFEVALLNARVYNRVSHKETLNAPSYSTARSQTWSALSGVSLSEVSVIAVIGLPLNDIDIEQFRQLTSSIGGPSDCGAHLYTKDELDQLYLPDHFLRTYGLKIPYKKHMTNMYRQRRLTMELRLMKFDLPPGISCGPTGDDLCHWEGAITGPNQTSYAGGLFRFCLAIPVGYPYEPVRVHFTTRVYHPNIDSKGRISLDILGSSWCSGHTITSVLISICSLLDDANPDEPLMPGVAHVYKTNRVLYDKRAREWTEKYAMGTDDM